MKQSIIFTAIITFGVAFPIGLITGIVVNKSTTVSKIASVETQAETDTTKAKEAVAYAENLQKQYEQLKNKNVQLSQELSTIKTKAMEAYNAQQNEAVSLQNEKLALIEQLNQKKEAQQQQMAKARTLKPEFVNKFGGNLKW